MHFGPALEACSGSNHRYGLRTGRRIAFVCNCGSYRWPYSGIPELIAASELAHTEGVPSGAALKEDA